MQHQPLSQERLQTLIPSAFAVEPWHNMSDKYRMIPTIQVIDHLAAHGFAPVKASQARTRIPGKSDFTRHVIRFSPENAVAVVGDTIPQIVLSNSHDGSSGYQIMLGLFRFVCTNGMTVSSGDINEIRVRHTGSKSLADDVLDATYTVIDQAPTAVKQIEDWSNHVLSDHQRSAYAEAALELTDHTLKPTPDQLLRVRRYEDQPKDVWHTFNTVQENLIKGGQFTRNANGQRRHVRAIKSVNEDLRLNRALWKLTEALANH